MEPAINAFALTETLQKITCPQCQYCLDSHILINAGNWEPCRRCPAAQPLLEPAAMQLYTELMRRTEQDIFISVPTLRLAQALVKSQATYPIPAYALMQHLKITNARSLKGMVESLRKDWHLPIGSNREEERSGYYWITNASDALNWFHTYTAQARAEFSTAYRLLQRHYPKLTGQINFNFTEEKDASSLTGPQEPNA